MTIKVEIIEDTAELAVRQMRNMLESLTPTITVTPPAERVAELRAEIAAHLKEDEPNPAPTPATPEKKTRSRKPKDAPAASVSSDDNGQPADTIAEVKALAAEGEKQFEADRQAAISTGEERVGPEDSEADAKQDEADEKAETEAAKTGLTLDDVRTALGEYVRLYGMAAAQSDGPVVISKVCGEGKVKVSDVTDDKIAAVVSGVREMIAKNPFSREKVAA